MTLTQSRGENFDRAYKALKYEYPDLASHFEKWFDDNEFPSEDLIDEFEEDIDDNQFIDYLNQNNVISNLKQQEVYHFLNNILSNKIDTKPPLNNDPNTSKPAIQTLTPTPTPPSLNATINLNPNPNPSHISYTDTMIYKILHTTITKNEKKQLIMKHNSSLKKAVDKQCKSLLPNDGNLNDNNPSISSSIFGKIKKKKKNQPNNKAQDILSVLLLGRKNNNYPLLLHLNDCLMRFYMNLWITNDKKKGIKISASQFFDKHCMNTDFQNGLNDINIRKIIQYFQSSIDSFHNRILPSFQLREPTYIIDENPLDFCRYMFEIARVVRNIANQSIHNHTTLMPTQLDFQIIHNSIIQNKPQSNACPGINDDDDDFDDAEMKKYFNSNKNLLDNDDDDDDDDDKDDDIDDMMAFDIESILKERNIRYKMYSSDALRELMRISDVLKNYADNKRSQRTVFIIDRRRSSGIDKDKLFLIRPDEHKDFNPKPKELINISLHHNSIASICPRSSGSSVINDYNARETLRGEMLVISYHLISLEEIRCYLFFEGCCFRFYGEDLINVLPLFFKDSDKAQYIMLKSLNNDAKWKKTFKDFCSTFTDKRFDEFYHSLIGKYPRLGVKKVSKQVIAKFDKIYNN